MTTGDDKPIATEDEEGDDALTVRTIDGPDGEGRVWLKSTLPGGKVRGVLLGQKDDVVEMFSEWLGWVEET